MNDKITYIGKAMLIDVEVTVIKTSTRMTALSEEAAILWDFHAL